MDLDTIAVYALWVVLYVGLTAPIWGPFALFFGLFHLLAEERSKRFWDGIGNRFSAFHTRYWRMLFPMHEERFQRWVKKACRERKEWHTTTVITYKAGMGLTAVLQADITLDGQDCQTTRQVIVTYQLGVFYFVCRVACPPPGPAPLLGDWYGATWMIEDDNGQHHLTLTRTRRDMDEGWRVLEEQIARTANDPAGVLARIESFQQAIAS